MRQAGRYLPEYRELRARAGSFLDLCYRPDFAAEVTLQPIRRFGFDAAILFSDILIIPHALGLKVEFLEGEGPRVETISSADEIGKLHRTLDAAKTGKVYEAIGMIRSQLPDETTLIGFVGAPWTVATYVVAGKGSKDHAETRLFALRDPEGFASLIDRLVDASIEHLSGQIEAGAEVVQIFDSWAGELPPDEFDRWCVRPVVRVIEGVRKRHPDVPVIAFPRGAGPKGGKLASILGVAIGLDTSEDMALMDQSLPKGTPIQGNLDPLVLIAGGEALDRSVDRIVASAGDRPHIFNLGHGIRPETPIAHVERLVERVRGNGRTR